MTTTRKPKGLGYQGGKLWDAVTSEFILGSEPHKLRILFDASKMADSIDAMEKAMQGQPMTVRGSAGQQVINPLISEQRFARALLAQLLARLNFEGVSDDE